MSRRFTSRPTPAMSIFAAVVGCFMLIFALVFFTSLPSHGDSGPAGLFLVVWVLALIGIIVYHVLNATRTGGVPTEIIEGEAPTPGARTAVERLQVLEDMQSRKLVSEAEYAAKRKEILDGV